MSENLMTLEKMVRENPELRCKVTELKKLPQKEAQEALIAIACEQGVELSEDDFAHMNWASIRREALSDSQMENVSGGRGWCGEDADDGRERRCWVYYHMPMDCCEACGCMVITENKQWKGGELRVECTCTRCPATWVYYA